MTTATETPPCIVKPWGLLDRLTVYAVLAIGISAAFSWLWLGDLASHFLPFYALVLAGLMPIVIRRKRRKTGALATIALGYCLWCFSPYYWPRSVRAGAPLTLISTSVIAFPSRSVISLSVSEILTAGPPERI